MSYWYSSLFVVIEAYESIGRKDPVVEALLAHPGQYKDLLRRYRNGVFHFQADLTDSRLLNLLQTGEEHVYWVHALHDEFKRLLGDRIEALSSTAEVSAKLRSTIHRLTGCLPDKRGRRDLELTLGRVRALVSREPPPEMRERHAELQATVLEVSGLLDTYEEKSRRLRRGMLQRLGITIAGHGV